MVRETDVLLMTGGDALYLNHWMSECGLATCCHCSTAQSG